MIAAIIGIILFLAVAINSKEKMDKAHNNSLRHYELQEYQKAKEEEDNANYQYAKFEGSIIFLVVVILLVIGYKLRIL